MLAMDDLRHPKPKCKCGVEPTSRADPASLTARTTEAGNAAGPTLVCRIQSGVPPARNKRRCPLQPAESFLARARAPPGARSDSVDVRARRPSPLHPAGPCSATPPALRLLPCAPLDVGRKDRCPLGTRLREALGEASRARRECGARAISVPGHAGRSDMGSQAQNSTLNSESAAAAPPPAAGPLTETNSVPPFSPPPPPPPPRPSPPSPPPSISRRRRRPSDMARAPRSPAPRRCPPLAAAPLVAAASPVNPAVRTTAATASRLAAAAAALPLAAERCLASLLTRPGRAAHSLP